jgi:hypothetical protein
VSTGPSEITLKKLTSSEITRCVTSFALMQQANRLPLVLARPPLPSPPSSDPGDPSSPTPTTPDFVHAMHLSLAAYGPLAINVLEHMPRGSYCTDPVSQLVAGTSTSNSTSTDSDQTGMGGVDFVLENYSHTSKYTPGYILLVDHARALVVLSLRGSLNINDVILDMTCLHVPCDELFRLAGISCAEDAFCHEGFFLSAANLDVLLSDKVLHCLAVNTGYRLLLCGHSMGAAVAAVLAVRWLTKFPGLR